MSLCPALTVATREMVPAGTAIGVSPDGRYLVQYIHTTQGVELKLRNRDTGEDRSVQLEPPSLPPGVTWQVHEIIFSPSGSLFAVRSVGAIWMLDAETAQVRYQIGVDGEKQAYPGKAALAEGQMAAAFWPPESYLADAVPKKPIEVRFYEAATGKVLRSLSLALDSAERWTKLALTPDGSRLAVLLRPTRWPGKARLRVYASEDGKLLWERKIGAEDMAWLGDGPGRIDRAGGKLRGAAAAAAAARGQHRHLPGRAALTNRPATSPGSRRPCWRRGDYSLQPRP